MASLTFVTSNQKKADEASTILPFPLLVHSLDLEEIQSLDSEKIVLHKTQQAYEAIHTPLFIDDVSLAIMKWNDFPGPLIKWLIQDGNELLLRLLAHESDRRATLTATIGYHDGKTIHVFSGAVSGVIANIAYEGQGWGFDPIFIPEGYDKTFAELGPDIKNTLSHRKRALEVFKEYLINHS